MAQSRFPADFQEFYVDPVAGSDEAAGDQENPHKTITYALQQITAGIAIVRLSPGSYSADSGEVFPLVIPPNVSMLGNSAGGDVSIEGGGVHNSPTFAEQNVAILLGDRAQLRGITVTNPNASGTGVWIESTAPTIANCTLIYCGREGIFVTGTANPTITSSVFRRNVSGITFVRNAKGEVRANLFRKTGFGMVVSDHAAPLIIDNQFFDNRSGIVLSGAARPVLRKNVVEYSKNDGVAIFGAASADLGNSQDEAGNFFGNNGAIDLRNATAAAVISVGNRLNPTRVSGGVNFRVSQVFGRLEAKRQAPVVRSQAPEATTPLPSPLPTPHVHWAEPFIKALTENRVIGSFQDGEFKPESRVSRAEYAMLLSRAFNLPAKGTSREFLDVPASHWAAAAIAQTEHMGFLTGFPDQTFRPEDDLTRLQVIVSLVKGLGLTGGNLIGLGVFRDRVQIPSHAATAVATAIQHRLVVLYPQIDRLNPLAKITHAEAVAMLYQGLVAIEQMRAIASPYLINPEPSVSR